MKVVLSKRQRFELAQFFVKMKVAGIDRIKSFNQTKRALGLTKIIAALLDGNGVPTAMVVNNTPEAWELSDVGVDLILSDILNSSDFMGAHAALLDEFIEALSVYKLTKEAPPVFAKDGDPDIEDWLPPKE